MKKLIYTLAFIVIGITSSYAQKPEREKLTADQRAEKIAITLQQKLNLTADQKAKVQQIELERIKQHEEWRKQDQGTIKNKMEERKAFMKASKEKIDAVLTPEQKKTLTASRDEIRDKMKDRKSAKGSRGSKASKNEDGTPPSSPAENN